MGEKDDIIDIEAARTTRALKDTPLDPTLQLALENYFAPPFGPYEWNEGRALRRFQEAASQLIEERRLREVPDQPEG